MVVGEEHGCEFYGYSRWRRCLLGVAAALILGASSARAAPTNVEVANRVKPMFPEVQSEQVRFNPELGLFEWFAEGKLFYISSDLKYLVRGEFINIDTKINVTQKRIQDLDRIVWADLPLDKAIQIVRGTGELQLAIFADPDCPYCKLLEKNLEHLDNVTLFIFLLPLPMHPNAERVSQSIWCGNDPAALWTKYMKAPIELEKSSSNCPTPLHAIKFLAKKLNVRATPTIFLKNGKRLLGAQSVESILEESK